MKKRLAMLVLAGAMVTSSLTGCGLKDSATVTTVAEMRFRQDLRISMQE